MNIKKIEKQLKKLNQLFETIKEDGTVSAIEKDLMLSYVRNLYEKMIESGDENQEPKDKSFKQKEKKQAPQIIQEQTTPPVQDNLANVVFQEVAESDRTITTPDVQSFAAAPTAVQEPVVQEIIEEPTIQAPKEILDLFEFETVNELSDKLSRSPIQDLTKSMGINEKIFTVQELFGGDSALFSKAMETMDNFKSLEQARDYLVDLVAVDQNWAGEGKVKKATNFIKLISRRY